MRFEPTSHLLQPCALPLSQIHFLCYMNVMSYSKENPKDPKGVFCKDLLAP